MFYENLLIVSIFIFLFAFILVACEIVYINLSKEYNQSKKYFKYKL